jgi:hypothetical protein
MKLSELFEGYDPKHKCKTPGAIYKTRFHANKILVSVKLPKHIDIPEDQVEDYEADLHYAVEKVLAPLFPKKK